jgi:hypothetical protein
MWYYDQLTGELIDQPRGFYKSTQLEPPAVEQNQCAKFINGAWHVVSDYRGVQFYRKSNGFPISLGLGDSPGDELTTLVRPSKFHRFDAGGWVIDYQAVRDDLHKRVAAFRLSMETGGITVSGVAIDTSRPAQAMLNQAYASLQAGFIQSVDWKGSSGWHALGLPEITALAQAAAVHVESCFSKEKAICSQLDALADEDLESFDIAAAWAALQG